VAPPSAGGFTHHWIEHIAEQVERWRSEGVRRVRPLWNAGIVRVLSALRDEAGEIPVAFVAIKRGHDVSEEEIASFVAGQPGQDPDSATPPG